MGRKKKTEDRGIILPFSQNADFYMNRSERYLDAEDYPRAIEACRKAFELEPNDPEIGLSLAELLNRFHRFEDSLCILLASPTFEEMPADALFGLACNYMALEEYEEAKCCLEEYLEYGEDCSFPEEANDSLDYLEDTRNLLMQSDVKSVAELDLIPRIRAARAMGDQEGQECLGALLELEKEYPDSQYLAFYIAQAEFSAQKTAEAEQRIFRILKKDKNCVRAICLQALLHISRGETEQAREDVARVKDAYIMGPQDLRALAAIHLELDDAALARKYLDKLELYAPYDPIALHMRARLSAGSGEREAAAEIYRTLLAVDVHDNIASYYLEALQRDDYPSDSRDWSPGYEVPIREAMRRLRLFESMNGTRMDAFQEKWDSEREFRDLVRWALQSAFVTHKIPLFQLLSRMEGWEAEHILRLFMLRMDQSDMDKAHALRALREKAPIVPVRMYIQGRWQTGTLRETVLPENLPTSYACILDRIERAGEEDVFPKEVCEVAAQVCILYLSLLEDRYPRITMAQEDALAAAFLCWAANAILGGDDIRTIDSICEYYTVSPARLNNAMKKLMRLLEDKIDKRKGEEE
ncbi:MAG: hypothetical protein FWF10_11010 [Clostridiales bacterium]|nr:hypothetical protein [Clostridiales bacterium]